MSDVDLPEVDPDNEPGEELQEALRGADADTGGEAVDANGNIEDDDPDL